MSGYSVNIGLLRAASAELDEKLSRAHDLVREVDSLVVPAGSFGRIGESVATTYAGLHERKIAALDAVIGRLRDAGGMAATVADMYQVRDTATADAIDRHRRELAP